MGLWDALTGRSKPVRANLDALFSLPAAAITLQTAGGFSPTGVGSVCFRAAEPRVAGVVAASTDDDASYTDEDKVVINERLRALGYID